MKLFHLSQLPKEIVNAPLFTGGKIARQTILAETESKNFNVSVIHFAPGARNKWHIHDCDQLLVATEGQGIIATEEEGEVPMQVGDVAHIPAGQKHWHGAVPSSAFAHITVTAVGSKLTQVEP
ncbi:MAG: cupin domain-containing protein [Candidatus Wildermuthbacteria bacterium]|nr:cupin domain-containing protein [Candidatus Wildermuthbacteria bacterium]